MEAAALVAREDATLHARVQLGEVRVNAVVLSVIDRSLRLLRRSVQPRFLNE
jgi:hypothetical protein